MRTNFFSQPIVILLASLLLLGGAITSNASQLQPDLPSDVSIEFDGAVTVPMSHREPITVALSAVSNHLPNAELFVVTNRRQDTNGVMYTLLPDYVLSSNWSEYSPEDIIKVLVPTSTSESLDATVTRIGSQQLNEFGHDIFEATPSATITVQAYKFPWKSELTWLKTRGWDSNHGNAIDFAPYSGGDYSVLAASNGLVDVTCNDGYQVTITIANEGGTATYVHLSAASANTVLDGKAIARGQYLGRIYDGTAQDNGACSSSIYPGLKWNTRCGCGYGAHIHFVPPNRDITIDGYAISSVANSANNTPYVSTNAPACCGCGASVATSSSPFGGQLVGPPSPDNETVESAATLELTIPGDLSLATEHPAVDDEDATPPSLEVASVEVQWTTDFDETILTWPAATDSGSGVSGYHVYWGPDERGTADAQVIDSAYQVVLPDTEAGAAFHYLRVAPRDNAGNLGEWQTVHIWQYDGIAPTGSVEVEGGNVVPILPVTLRLAVTDEHSGVTDMRFSSDGQSWSEWEQYAATRGWQLAEVDGPQTVYAQFRDAAGNVSEPATVAVSRDFTTSLPSSANYQLARTVMGMGGGAKSSSSYRLLGTSGQPYETGALQSSSYRLASGYWAHGAATSTNNPPSVPSNSSPAHNAADVDVTATLSWSAIDPDTDPLTYDVYFGTVNPPPLVATGQSATTYNPPGDLAYSTTHYWQIVAKDDHDNVTSGPVWSFTTVDAPPGDQTVTVSPAADTYTNSGYPTSNYGNASTLNVKDASRDMTAYLQFDTGLSCAVITHATLRLNVTDSSDDGGDVYEVDSNWSEGGLTAGNAPSLPASPLDSAGVVSSGQWVEFDVTGGVSGDTVAFAIMNGSSDLAKYSSKEGANPPELVIEYQEQTGAAPLAAFSFSPSNPVAGQPVQFNDQSTGCPSSWSWAFGDGSTSNERHPAHSFTTGDHDVTLTVSNGSGSDDITYTISVAEPPAGETIYLSPQKAGSVGGVSFAPADIVAYNTGTGIWSMFFDASDVGITKNVNAFTVLDDGSILLAFKANQSVSGLGTVTAQDVVRYVPAADRFEWLIDGSDIGLTTSGERIDALAIDPATGNLLLSTVGTAKVPSLGGIVVSHDEDVLALDVTTPGSNTAVVASLYMDGTAVTGLKGEDINGVWVDGDTGDVYIVILGGFNLGGVGGNGRDIVRLTPSGNSYTPVEIYWDGSAEGFPVNLDGVSIAK